METFVVRIWTPAARDVAAHAAAGLHGVVEHLGNADSRPFSSDDELVRFLHAGLRHTHHLSEAPSDRPLNRRRTRGDSA